MVIYHFNRLIRSRILWGFFAVIIAVAFVAVDSCFKAPQDMQTAGTLNGKKVSLNQFEQVVQAIRGFGRNRDNETSANVSTAAPGSSSPPAPPPRRTACRPARKRSAP